MAIVWDRDHEGGFFVKELAFTNTDGIGMVLETNENIDIFESIDTLADQEDKRLAKIAFAREVQQHAEQLANRYIALTLIKNQPVRLVSQALFIPMIIQLIVFTFSHLQPATAEEADRKNNIQIGFAAFNALLFLLLFSWTLHSLFKSARPHAINICGFFTGDQPNYATAEKDLNDFSIFINRLPGYIRGIVMARLQNITLSPMTYLSFSCFIKGSASFNPRSGLFFRENIDYAGEARIDWEESVESDRRALLLSSLPK